MLEAHGIIGLAVLVVAVLVVAVGGLTYRRGTEPRGIVNQLLALGQTVLIAQVALGLLLLSGERRANDELHYVYGFLALGAVLSPWLYAPADPRRRLAWFVGATLLAGALATRAYTTGS